MDMNTNPMAVQTAPQTAEKAPAPPQTDGRPAADAAATKTDPQPEVPLPLPARPSQNGLVSQAALSKSDAALKSDAAPKSDTSDLSAAERTLKPYGINMLPEENDASKQQADDPETG